MLNGDQLVDFELRLEEEIEAQEAAIERSRDGTATVKVDSAFGRVSRADSLLQQAMAQDGLRRAEERLVALRMALQRLHDGTYGFCIRCQRDIELARLEAKPESPQCGGCSG